MNSFGRSCDIVCRFKCSFRKYVRLQPGCWQENGIFKKEGDKAKNREGESCAVECLVRVMKAVCLGRKKDYPNGIPCVI